MGDHRGGVGLTDTFLRPREHGAAQIDEMTIQAPDLLQQAQGEVSRTAAEIQDRATGMDVASTSFRHQFQNQLRVDGGLLTRFKIAEPLDIMIEAVSDFFEGRFVFQGRAHHQAIA